MDRWWNEPTNQQAIDRTHRIGQKNAVEVIYPVIRDSVDEVLDSVLSKKAAASEGFLQETRVRSEVIDLRGLRRKKQEDFQESSIEEVI